MDIAQLKTLIHVAELGSLSKAADRLHIAQPALSRQIRLLEKELGTMLFERHGRGMVITDVGREVLEHATQIMNGMELIRNVPGRARSSLKGVVKVGTTPTVAEIVTVPLVRKVEESHPQLRIRLTAAYSVYLIDWLQRGILDVAISYDPEPLKSLRIIPIMMEDLLYVSAASKRRKFKQPMSFARLATERLVLPSPGHGLRVIMEQCAQKAGIDLSASVEADSFGAMIDLVRNGFGSTVLPLAPIYPLVQSGVLTAVPLKDPVPQRKLVLVYPAERAVSPAVRFVGDTLISIAADLVDRKVWAGRMLSQPKK
jgi:LysR family transcriptional regulator, nitrogen assimilation regulatory protein